MQVSVQEKTVRLQRPWSKVKLVTNSVLPSWSVFSSAKSKETQGQQLHIKKANVFILVTFHFTAFSEDNSRTYEGSSGTLFTRRRSLIQLSQILLELISAW